MQAREHLREPAIIFWSLGFPIISVALLGQMGAGASKSMASIAVVATQSQQAKATLWAQQAPTGDGRFRFQVMAADEALRSLARGRSRLILDQAWDDLARVGRFDPADKEAELAWRRLDSVLRGGKLADGWIAETRAGGRYVDFLLPGLIAFGLVSSCLWGVGWTLVEYRQRKFLRRVMATPMPPLSLFGGLFAARVLLAGMEALTLATFGALAYGVRPSGSLAALLVTLLCGLYAFFGLAVLMASRTERSQVGQGLINAVTLPCFVLCGVYFSLDAYPSWLQSLCRLLPPTMLVDTVREIYNAGAGWAQIGVPCAALLAMGTVCLGLGVRFFRYY